ncbi:MAG: putative PEP-binding protein [Treponemataceae bacterium]
MHTLIKNTSFDELQRMLIPTFDEKSFIPDFEGGIIGSYGAASGQIFFSSESLIDAYEQCLSQNKTPHLFLCLRAIDANDIHALSLSCGVISIESNFTDHASVIARQYGKISVFFPEAKIDSEKKEIVIQRNCSLHEGQWLTIVACEYNQKAQFFFECIPLIRSDSKELDALLKECKQVIAMQNNSLKIFANADTVSDAKKALQFYADGIGLCRTEHQFFSPERFSLIQHILETQNQTDLQKLQDLQTQDFFDLLSILDGKPLTVRLLDAPLHEFGFAHEKNPMLGLRGSRLAFAYPYIYKAQVIALANACNQFFQISGDLKKINLKIMLPMIINEKETRHLLFGKKMINEVYQGLRDIFFEHCKLNLHNTLSFGTMIETPKACLVAEKIAQTSSFFSFGTNDLTQCTLSLSRDDFFRFSTLYEKFDLIKNPFLYLDDSVKELIHHACLKAKIIRPDIELSLCGEHAGIINTNAQIGNDNATTIDFCLMNHFTSVSVLPYAIPKVLLYLAKKYID